VNAPGLKPGEKHLHGVDVARRVFLFRMLAVKNSRKRRAPCSPAEAMMTGMPSRPALASAFEWWTAGAPGSAWGFSLLLPVPHVRREAPEWLVSPGRHTALRCQARAQAGDRESSSRGGAEAARRELRGGGVGRYPSVAPSRAERRASERCRSPLQESSRRLRPRYARPGIPRCL
jgi:hypothetical protein